MKRATAKLVADFGDDLVRYKIECPVCGYKMEYEVVADSRPTIVDCDECEEIIGIRYVEDHC